MKNHHRRAQEHPDRSRLLGRENPGACLKSSANGNGKTPARQSDSGQIVVEYVLLLVVAVTIAIFLTSRMISRNPGNPGFVIGGWDKIIRQIGLDYSGESRP